MLNTKSPCPIHRELLAAYLTAVEKVGVAQLEYAAIGMASAVSRTLLEELKEECSAARSRSMPNTVISTPAEPAPQPWGGSQWIGNSKRMGTNGRLVTALLMLLTLLKGIRRDRKAKRAEKVDDCIRNHFAGQPQGQKYPLEDIFENLATAREIVNRQMKRPSLKEVKESLNRLTKAGSLETDGIRWGRPRISLERRL